MLAQSLSNLPGPLIEDIFVVPNYEEYLSKCIDPQFGGYAKGEKTQHQFIFEAVEPDQIFFPFGCKTTYRAYSADNVLEIIEVPEELHGLPGMKLRPQQCQVSTFPAPSADGTFPGGMHILRQWPLREDVPFQQIVPESRCVFEEIMEEVVKHWAISKPSDVAKWKEWDEMYVPKTDSLEDYKIK
jgi:hypothetical protein